MIDIAEEETEEGKIDCPTCGAKIPADSTECPECGEKIGGEEEAKPEEEEEVPAAEEAKPAKPTTFYAGILVFLIGLALLAGPFVNDAMGATPPVGNKGIGIVDQAVMAVGFILLIVGILVLVMKKPAPAAEEAPAEATETEAEKEEKTE